MPHKVEIPVDTENVGRDLRGQLLRYLLQVKEASHRVTQKAEETGYVAEAVPFTDTFTSLWKELWGWPSSPQGDQLAGCHT